MSAVLLVDSLYLQQVDMMKPIFFSLFFGNDGMPREPSMLWGNAQFNMQAAFVLGGTVYPL